MENPYNDNHNNSYYQPYTPQSSPEPSPSGFQGNHTMASLSLVMGILALLSVCCMPPALFVFAGLGILFSCLSKGQYARSGPAKAGMAICVSALVLASAFIISLCTFFMVTDEGRAFMEDYFSILFSDEPAEEELYDFLDKYLYEGEDFPDGYDDYDDYDSYDNYDRHDEYDDFFDDEMPFYYEQPDTMPDSNGEGNFI